MHELDQHSWGTAQAIEDQDAAILCYAACANNVEAAAAPESPPVLEGFTEVSIPLTTSLVLSLFLSLFLSFPVETAR